MATRAALPALKTAIQVQAAVELVEVAEIVIITGTDRAGPGGPLVISLVLFFLLLCRQQQFQQLGRLAFLPVEEEVPNHKMQVQAVREVEAMAREAVQDLLASQTLVEEVAAFAGLALVAAGVQVLLLLGTRLDLLSGFSDYLAFLRSSERNNRHH